jgi:hypothetical protein
MPIRLCEYVTNSTDVDPREYGTTVWQGAYVFSVNSANASLDIQGRITHIEDLDAFREDWWDFRDQFIHRTGYIESMYYAISNSKITFHDLTDLNLLSELSFI